jgi:release factor glutamine methyltransferase
VGVVSAFGGASVREALDSAVIAIAAAGSDTPRLDAEVLLADALGIDRTALFMDPGREVAGPAVRAFQDAVRRRSAGREPVAYIIGRRGFRHLELEVDARVLVPRPETELLVEVGLEMLADGARVADVGTGSGAVALALAQERPDLDVVATDVSADALLVARANASRLGLGERVEFREGDLLAGVGRLDAVLSNPPYVAEAERATLAPEITRHEPPGALFAGEDGLDVIRRLVPAARAAGAELLAIEVGEGQAAAVGGLMRMAGFTTVVARRDLAGIERVMIGSR